MFNRKEIEYNIRALIETWLFDKKLSQNTFSLEFRNDGKSEKEISRLVIEQLQRTPKRSNKKNKLDTPDMQHMRDFLGIQED